MKRHIEALHNESLSVFDAENFDLNYYLDTVRDFDVHKMSFRGNTEGLFRLAVILLGIATEKVGNFWHLDEASNLVECEIAVVAGMDDGIKAKALRPVWQLGERCEAGATRGISGRVREFALDIARCVEMYGCAESAMLHIRYDAEYDYALLTFNKSGLVLMAGEAMRLATTGATGEEVLIPENGDLVLSVQLVETPW